jgi:hypothetical protein
LPRDEYKARQGDTILVKNERKIEKKKEKKIRQDWQGGPNIQDLASRGSLGDALKT